MHDRARHWLQQITALPLAAPVRIMNVCGGHERAIALAGLRSLLPPAVQLIPGPGCPVCICPEEDIRQAIDWALHHEVIVASFGDMLRVPVNLPRGEVNSLTVAKAAGADVRAIAAPTEAIRIASENPARTVVLHAVGFETTMAPIAALIGQGLPANLLILASGRRTWPAVAMLLDSPDAGLDALIAPGHVATVMGPEEWAFVPQHHRLPAAIAGFTADSLLAAILSVLVQSLEGKPALTNGYAAAVKPGGNARARQLLAQAFDVVDAPWRGIGTIAQSGYALKPELAAHDARRRLPPVTPRLRGPGNDLPPGCDCARVVLGKISPPACRLYGTACRPASPIGPCMVSDEGAGRIWWSAGLHQRPPSRATSAGIPS